MNSVAMLAPASLSAFVFAGNATFTVRSERTGNRFTFKMRKPQENGPHFLSLLSGSDNENDFKFIGTVFPSGEYRHGKRSRVNESAPSAKAARWVIERVLKGEPLKGCEVWHEGKCGRCGRKLTVPESIELGLGPECMTRA